MTDLYISDYIGTGGSVSSRGTIDYVELLPDNWQIDNTEADVYEDDIFGGTYCGSFCPSGEGTGSVWANCKIPDGFDTSKALKVKAVYTFPTASSGTNVNITTRLYETELGESYSTAYPTVQTNKTIGNTSSNAGVFAEVELGSVTIDDDSYYLTFKFTRNADEDNDTYGSDLKIASFIVYQED